MEKINGVVGNFPEQEVLKKGVATVRHLTMTDEMCKMQHLRTVVNGGKWYELIEPGEYVQLYVHGELMMSDTQMERITNSQFIAMARGEVMIAGLGIGMILEALIPKVEAGVVTRIVVYEKYQDVIDLVAHRYIGRLPLEIRCEDILEYKPKKGEVYDTMYFDIWPSVCADNLNDINMLHHRWCRHKRSKLSWMGSWMQAECQNMKRRENKRYWY